MKSTDLLKKVHQLEIATRTLVNQIFSGEYHSVFKGRGMEFSEVREYQFGDDIRTIDWNVTARFDHPFVKVFEEERELTLMLLVDMSGSQEFGTKAKSKMEIAAEISAILAFSALKNNDKVGCILFTDKIEKFIPPRKKKTHVLRIIREILDFTPENKKTNIRLALEYFNSAIKRKSIVFLISDFLDEGYDSLLKVVARKHDFVSIVLQDEKETAFPKAGLIRLRDPETGIERVVDASHPAFQHLFRTVAPKRAQALNKLFSVGKVDSVWLSTPDSSDEFSYLKPLIRFFKQRARRW
jgi:uncharacterized protein (DUF58 family)